MTRQMTVINKKNVVFLGRLLDVKDGTGKAKGMKASYAKLRGKEKHIRAAKRSEITRKRVNQI